MSRPTRRAPAPSVQHMCTTRLVIVSGLSGSGKSQAIKALEDLGFFCVDNLPVALLPTLAELRDELDGPNLILLHDGHIEVKSELGRGTTCIVHMRNHRHMPFPDR